MRFDLLALLWLFSFPVQLFDDICPKLCKNFMQLITSAETGKTYRNTIFHRLVKDGWMQGGGESVFDEPAVPHNQNLPMFMYVNFSASDLMRKHGRVLYKYASYGQTCNRLLYHT